MNVNKKFKVVCSVLVYSRLLFSLPHITCYTQLSVHFLLGVRCTWWVVLGLGGHSASPVFPPLPDRAQPMMYEMSLSLNQQGRVCCFTTARYRMTRLTENQSPCYSLCQHEVCFPKLLPLPAAKGHLFLALDSLRLLLWQRWTWCWVEFFNQHLFCATKQSSIVWLVFLVVISLWSVCVSLTASSSIISSKTEHVDGSEEEMIEVSSEMFKAKLAMINVTTLTAVGQMFNRALSLCCRKQRNLELFLHQW